MRLSGMAILLAVVSMPAQVRSQQEIPVMPRLRVELSDGYIQVRLAGMDPYVASLEWEGESQTRLADVALKLTAVADCAGEKESWTGQVKIYVTRMRREDLAAQFHEHDWGIDDCKPTPTGLELVDVRIPEQGSEDEINGSTSARDFLTRGLQRRELKVWSEGISDLSWIARNSTWLWTTRGRAS